MSFPLKMMALLDEGNQYSDVICWLPHGRGFTILDKKKFETEVMPKYFQDAKYTSFTRRLRRWNFRIQTHGHKRSSYFHPSFVKGREDLCREMKALPQVRKRRSSSGVGMGSAGGSMCSSNFSPLRRQGHAYQENGHFPTCSIPCTVLPTTTTTGAAATTTAGNGERSMKGPLKKRISAITAHPNNDTNSDMNDTHAVVSTNGSCDSSSSVGDSVDSSFSTGRRGAGGCEKQGTAAAVNGGETFATKTASSPQTSSLAMPPLAQPTSSSARNARNNHVSHEANVENTMTATNHTAVPMNTVNTVFCYPPPTNSNAPGNYTAGNSLPPPPQSINMLNGVGMQNSYCHQPPQFVPPQQPHQIHFQQQQQQQPQHHQHHPMMTYCNNSMDPYAASPPAPTMTTTTYTTNMMPPPSSSFNHSSSDPRHPHHTSSSWNSNGPISHFSLHNMLSGPSPSIAASIPNMSNNNNNMGGGYPMEHSHHFMSSMGYNGGVVLNPNGRGGGGNMMHPATAVHQQGPPTHGFVHHNQAFHQHPNMMAANMYSTYNVM